MLFRNRAKTISIYNLNRFKNLISFLTYSSLDISMHKRRLLQTRTCTFRRCRYLLTLSLSYWFAARSRHCKYTYLVHNEIFPIAKSRDYPTRHCEIGAHFRSAWTWTSTFLHSIRTITKNCQIHSEIEHEGRKGADESSPGCHAIFRRMCVCVCVQFFSSCNKASSSLNL